MGSSRNPNFAARLQLLLSLAGPRCSSWELSCKNHHRSLCGATESVHPLWWGGKPIFLPSSSHPGSHGTSGLVGPPQADPRLSSDVSSSARPRMRPGALGRQRSAFPWNNNTISLASAPLQKKNQKTKNTAVVFLISRLEKKTGAELCPAGSWPGRIHPGCSAQPPLGPALLRCAGEGPRLLQPLEGFRASFGVGGERQWGLGQDGAGMVLEPG